MTLPVTVIQLTQNDEKRWNNLLIAGQNSTYMSGMSYEYVKVNNGREIETFVFQLGGEDVAGVHYSIKNSYANIIRIADVLSGFIFRYEPDDEMVSYLLNHFINWSYQKNASFARLTTWLPKLIEGNKTPYSLLIENATCNAGFKAVKKGRNTYWIDLAKSEEQLLAKMRPQTRSKLRKGILSDAITERYDNPTPEVIEKFWSLYNQLGKRKNFETLPELRFKLEVKSLMSSGLASLFLTYFQDQLVNAALASNFGRTMYFHGAVNPEYKALAGCPSVGHLAQWEMIKNMKMKGLKTYDMAFCPGPVPLENDPRFDMWRFKYGFGGEYVEFLPTYGKVLKPLRGRLFQFLKYRKWAL